MRGEAPVHEIIKISFTMLNYKNKIFFLDLDKELKKISEKIEGLKFPQGFLEYVLYVISEILINIKEHSRAKSISLNIRINQQRCRIDIRDDGIGFRESYLRKKIYPKDDFSAIEFALSGLSTKDPRERGFGLYSIRKLVETLGGILIIEAGLARAIIKKNKINFLKVSKKRQGVLINIESSVKSISFYKIIK